MEKPPLYKRRSTHVSLVVVALVFFGILLALPHIIEYNVKQWILENGNNHVTVENVDFNSPPRAISQRSFSWYLH